MKDDRVYLKHILRCIARIEEYTAGGRDSFLASHLIQDGVIRNLQTLAESSQHLSDAVKASQPAVDWKGLAGFRFTAPLAAICRPVARLAAPGNYRAPLPTGRRPSITSPASSLHGDRSNPVAWLAHNWPGWHSAVYVIKPETVIAWHRRGFRLFWTWKSRHRIGRPAVPHDVRALIREMSTANPLWDRSVRQLN